VLTSDGEGKFSAPDLSAGKYSVRVSKDGFEDSLTPIELKAAAETDHRVAADQHKRDGEAAAFANSDAVYRQLRDLGLGKTYTARISRCRWTRERLS
jgi:hypothetical protein